MSAGYTHQRACSGIDIPNAWRRNNAGCDRARLVATLFVCAGGDEVRGLDAFGVVVLPALPAEGRAGAIGSGAHHGDAQSMTARLECGTAGGFTRGRARSAGAHQLISYAQFDPIAAGDGKALQSGASDYQQSFILQNAVGNVVCP